MHVTVPLPHRVPGEHMHIRKITVLAAVLAAAPLAARADGTILMLNGTLTGGAGSREANEARSLGYAVDIRDNWDGMSVADFASYRAIVLGDPTCTGNRGVVAPADRT